GWAGAGAPPGAGSGRGWGWGECWTWRFLRGRVAPLTRHNRLMTGAADSAPSARQRRHAGYRPTMTNHPRWLWSRNLLLQGQWATRPVLSERLPGARHRPPRPRRGGPGGWWPGPSAGLQGRRRILVLPVLCWKSR